MRIVVPEQVVEQFKLRAAKNRRSVTQEILFTLEQMGEEGRKGGESREPFGAYDPRDYPRR